MRICSRRAVASAADQGGAAALAAAHQDDAAPAAGGHGDGRGDDRGVGAVRARLQHAAELGQMEWGMEVVPARRKHDRARQQAGLEEAQLAERNYTATGRRGAGHRVGGGTPAAAPDAHALHRHRRPCQPKVAPQQAQDGQAGAGAVGVYTYTHPVLSEFVFDIQYKPCQAGCTWCPTRCLPRGAAGHLPRDAAGCCRCHDWRVPGGHCDGGVACGTC